MSDLFSNFHLRSHRPAYNYGPHTSLFHPAFAKFKHRADRLDEDSVWQGDLEPSAALLEHCHTFITSSCDIFEDEAARSKLLSPFFDKVLSEQPEVLMQARKAEVDAWMLRLAALTQRDTCKNA